MPMRLIVSILLVTFLMTACTPPSTPPEPDAPTASVSQPEPAEAIPEPTQGPDPLSTPEAGPVVETVASDCLGGEVSPIGQSIAEEYDFTSYEEVITWFCNGAEFEDIFAALETESQTGTPAEEMLQMLADGFTWDEIWQIIGLTD